MAERVEGLGLGLLLEGLVAEGRGVDVLAGPGAGRRGVLRGGLHGLLLDVGGVALADALGGAAPLAVFLGPAVLGLAPVVAERVEGLGLGLGLKALMGKGGGVGPRALLSAGGRVCGGCLYGFLNLPAAIAALGMTGAIPAIGLLLPNIFFLVFEVIFVLAVGVAVGEHLAAGPNELAVDGYIGAGGVVTRLAAKAKELRAGGLVALCRGRAICDVEDVLEVPHVGVIDVQRLLIDAPERFRVELAVVHVDGNVMAARTVIGEDVDRLAGAIEGAAIERHGRRAVCPDGIVATGRVERGVVELSTLIAPVERLAVDDAAVDDGVVRTDEAKVVDAAGTQRHVLKRYGAGAVEGIVAVVLGAIVVGIGNLCADVPRRLIRTLALKGKVFALGVLLGAHPVQSVVALAEQDGVAALRLGGCGGQLGVGLTSAGVGDRAGATVCKSRRANPPQRDECDGKQRCDCASCRLGKRLHTETPLLLVVIKA